MSEIAFPVRKAASALAAGAGTSALSVAAEPAVNKALVVFGLPLPADWAGWLAFGASGAALIYSLCLLTEWWWKKVWKPLLARQKHGF